MEHVKNSKVRTNVILTAAAAVLLAGAGLYSSRYDSKAHGTPTDSQGLVNHAALFAAYAPSNDGASAPDFTFKSVSGKTITLSDYRGKVVILDFWATWCPPCKAEIPDFIKLYSDYRKDGFQMLGISVDQGGLADVKPFMREYGVNYPIMLATDNVIEAYGGIRGIPTTSVIDKKGRIVDKFVGYRPASEFKAVIEKLTKEK